VSRRSLFVAALLIATSLSAAGEMHVSGNAIIVDGRKVVEDPSGIELASLSPRGKLIAYSHSLADAIVIVHNDGTSLRTIRITDDLAINAVMKIGWLDDRRVWIDGHRSPSSGPFCVWDVESGKRLDEREGAMFTPSPDGHMIAQLEPMPGHRPAWFPGPRILIEGHAVYPLRGVPGDFRELVWSPDASFLAFSESFDERQQIVVIRPDGRVRKRMNIEGAPIADLTWTGRRKLTYSQDGVPRTLLVRSR
jgi:hypothetical protein